MKTRFTRTLVGIMLVVGLFAEAACHRNHTPTERAEWMTEKIAKHLNLDEQQKARLAVVKDEALAARAESQKEHHALTEELIAQVQSDRLDQANVARLFEQHQAEQTRMMQRVLPKLAEWHAGLRPEQKAEAVEHIRRWMARHEGTR